MNWIELNSEAQLEHIVHSPHIAVIFKHSTRCAVSSMAKRSLESDADMIPNDTPFYYLDLLRHRDLSNQIAAKWNVVHQSPQILIVQGERCVYHASHEDVQMQTIVPFIQ